MQQIKLNSNVITTIRGCITNEGCEIFTFKLNQGLQMEEAKCLYLNLTRFTNGGSQKFTFKLNQGLQMEEAKCF